MDTTHHPVGDRTTAGYRHRAGVARPGWLRSGRSIVVLAVVAAAAVAGCSSSNDAGAAAPTATATAGPTNDPLKAYHDYFRVSDAARRNPLAEDWAPRFAEVSVDPEWTAAIDQWRKVRDLGLRFYGDTVLVDPQITAQTDKTATIADCRDENAVTADQNGRPLPNDPTRLRRARVTATVVLDGLTWKVSDQQLLRDQPC